MEPGDPVDSAKAEVGPAGDVDAVPDEIPVDAERTEAEGEAALEAGPRPAPGPDDVLPEPSDRAALADKEYFKIGEVSRIVGVKPYVLRYWESEFKRDIRPERSGANQRRYRRKDVETFLEIKRLRYEQKLELPGARRELEAQKRATRRRPASEARSAAEAATAAREISGAPVEAPGEVTAKVTPKSASRGLLAELHDALTALLQMVDEDEKRG